MLWAAGAVRGPRLAHGSSLQRVLHQPPPSQIIKHTDANFATYDSCLLASAAWIDAARHTLLGDDANEGSSSQDESSAAVRRPSFALARPPGHHATRSEAGGFCIFNHCIVAARYALDHLGCKRVAILDW